MDNSITIKLVYLPQDFLRVTYFFQRTIYLRKYWIILLPLGTFLGIIGLIFSMRYKTDDLRIFAIFICALIPSAIIFFVILLLDKTSNWTVKNDKITPWILNKSIAKHYKNHSQLDEAVSVTFSNEGVKYAFASLTEEYDWNFFKKAIECETDIFLFTCNKDAQFIPKRAFANEEQINQVRELAKERLGNKAKF